MPIVRMGKDSGRPELTTARWGLIPFWAKDAKIGYSTINARAETVATKPAFREAFKRRRCLVPASGYYEWQKRPDGQKQPHYFTSRDDSLLMFAGLWEYWKPKEGEPITSYTIIVCAPNPLCAAVHDRMPVIIDEKHWEHWLEGERDPGKLLKPAPDEALRVYQVSTAVNSPKNEGAELIAEIPA